MCMNKLLDFRSKVGMILQNITFQLIVGNNMMIYEKHFLSVSSDTGFLKCF